MKAVALSTLYLVALVAGKIGDTCTYAGIKGKCRSTSDCDKAACSRTGGGSAKGAWEEESGFSWEQDLEGRIRPVSDLVFWGFERGINRTQASSGGVG